MDRRSYLGAVAAGLLAGCGGNTGTPTPTSTVSLGDLERISGPYADVARWMPAIRGEYSHLKFVRSTNVERYLAVRDRFPSTHTGLLALPRGDGLETLLTPEDVRLQIGGALSRSEADFRFTVYETTKDMDKIAEELRAGPYSVVSESAGFRVFVPGPEGGRDGHKPLVLGHGFLVWVQDPFVSRVADDQDERVTWIERIGETYAGDWPSYFAMCEAFRTIVERLSPGLATLVNTGRQYVTLPGYEGPLKGSLAQGLSTTVDGDTAELSAYIGYRSADAIDEEVLQQYIANNDTFQQYESVEYELDGRVAEIEAQGAVDSVFTTSVF